MSTIHTLEAFELERWKQIVRDHEILANGHKLVTHGAHTGHHVQTIALCESQEIAVALAEALRFSRIASRHTANMAGRILRLEAALHPFAVYAEARAAKPMPALGDSIHEIHVGNKWHAVLTLTHCEAARVALADKSAGRAE